MKGRSILMLLLACLATCPFCTSESPLFEEWDWTLGEEGFEVLIEAEGSESPFFEGSDSAFGQDKFGASAEADSSESRGPFGILSYLGGDGQEAMPGEELTSPFEVGLSSVDGRPIQLARIQFTITEGTGELRSSGGTAVGTRIVVKTDTNGIAKCFCRLDGDLRVKAETLYSTRNPVPIWFSAKASVAEEVAYDASGCTQVENAETVQEAIDELCSQMTFSYVGGDGQGAMPGDWLPAPLQVRVSRGELPVEGAEIEFEILEGQGVLDPPGGSVITGKDGIAQCSCRFDEELESPQLRVRAMLIDVVSPDENGDPSHPAIIFNANAMVAEEVAYSPPLECLQLPGVETVGDAINDLGRQVSFSYIGGDGQETMPGNELHEPFRVRVARGSYPVTGAMVQFKIENGKGELRKYNGETGEELDVPTDDDGIATCLCSRLDEDATIEAKLRTPTPTDQSPIWFNAKVSVAEEVAYDPTNCPRLSRARDVQSAIDGLCRMIPVEASRVVWVHGNSLQVQPLEGENIVIRANAYSLVELAEGSRARMHFSIPTTAAIGGSSYTQADEVLLRLKCSDEYFVLSVSIYDGETQIHEVEVPVQGNWETIHIPIGRPISTGLGISIEVEAISEPKQIAFSAAGCQFSSKQ